MSDNSFWEAAERMMSMGLLADGVRGQPGEEREAVRAKVLGRTAKHLAALHDEWTEEGRRAGRAEMFDDFKRKRDRLDPLNDSLDTVFEVLAKKERESAEDVRKRLGFKPLSEDQKDENFEHNTGAKKERTP